VSYCYIAYFIPNQDLLLHAGNDLATVDESEAVNISFSTIYSPNLKYRYNDNLLSKYDLISDKEGILKTSYNSKNFSCVDVSSKNR